MKEDDQVHTRYDVGQGAQGRLHLSDLARVLGDKVVVHCEPFWRQREGIAEVAVGGGRRDVGRRPPVLAARIRHPEMSVSGHGGG